MRRIEEAKAGIVHCAFEGEKPEGTFSNGDALATVRDGEALFGVNGNGAFFVDVFSDVGSWPAGREETMLAR